VIALGRASRRAVHAGEGVDRGRDRHQHLFMLGASFLLGGLKHHVQEYNRVGARFQASLLFLATIALLVPSAMAQGRPGGRGLPFTRTLSLGLAIVLIAAYCPGMLFSSRLTPSSSAARSTRGGRGALAPGLALPTLAGVTVLVALVSEVFVESVQQAATEFGMSPAFVGSSSWPWWAARRRWPRRSPGRARTAWT
jgi:Ca2+:H+ antiporter